MSKVNLSIIAEQILNSNPVWVDIEDDVSLCRYVFRTQQIDLTMKQAAKVRVIYNRIEFQRRHDSEKIDCYTVVYIDNADMRILKARSFRKTIEGRDVAQQVFTEWATEIDYLDSTPEELEQAFKNRTFSCDEITLLLIENTEIPF